MEQFDALIVGHGPAGCSAALYLCRAGLRTAMVGKDRGALERAERIENYYGLASPLRGLELMEIGQAQCRALGASLLRDEVLSLELREDLSFTAQASSGLELSAKAVLLATGKAKAVPGIEGIRSFEGHGVSYCAVCDAFLYRGREVAVLGAGVYAKHEMEALLPLARRVTLLTNGAKPDFDIPDKIAVIRQKILRLTGEETLRGAVLEDGGALEFQGLFVALGSATAGDLARKLGARLERDAIAVNTRQETTLPGLYAAGDCTGSFPQVSIAVAEGAKAGMSMVSHLRKKSRGAQSQEE
ncbi:MAG: NAD(P)/FAD-dependent oxidoreductase [Oscillospiraceae bacterium]|nr:NAD(P)/FAD-dependent oxidoreductase [Oscillospiraceae bacterium]